MRTPLVTALIGTLLVAISPQSPAENSAASHPRNFAPRAALPAAVDVAPPAPPFGAPWLSFNTALASPAGGSPIQLATGDVDGDGDVDVVAARAYAVGGFVFLRNEGAGRLAQPVNYAGTGRSSDIVLADLNGDTKLDVALSDGDALTTGNTVSVYFGNGNGTFGARQPISLGTGTVIPVGLAATDLDGDTDLDLAVAAFGFNGGGTSVLLLSNNGNGTFTAPVSITVGGNPYDVAAGDLSGDGRPDLVVAHNDYRVSVLVNNGTGGFGPAIAYDNLSSTNWAGPFFPSVALADVDRDTRLDVLYGNTRTWDGLTGHVVQLRNTGSGALSRGADIPLVFYTAGPTDIKTADLNGDGAPDILAASYSGRADDGVCVMMNNGTGGFGPATLYPAGQATNALGVADMNGDGKVDVLTTDSYSNAITIRLNPGNGMFATIPMEYAGSFQFYQDAADVDGDGDIDIFTSGPHPSADGGAIMRNSGNGSFNRTYFGNGNDGVAEGVLRDLNGDRKPDLLFNNANTSSQYDFFTSMNNGDGTFPPATRWVVQSAGWGAIDAFDLDGDGDLDVVDMEALGAPGIPDGRFFIALNNGNGTFQTPYAYAQLPRRPNEVVGADFNHDGKIDLAMTNQGAYGFDSSVFIVLGNGNGTFQAPIIYTAGRGPINIVTADLDDDGNLDLATLNSGYNGEGAETLTLLFGTGTGTFNRLSTQYAPFSPDLLGATGIVSGDVDGDGDVDLMTSGTSNDIGLYLNDGAGAFAFPYRMGVVPGTHAPIYRDFTGDGIADLAVLGSPPPAGFDGGVAVLRGIPTVPVLQSAVSRKIHGAAGPFDISLPLTGAPGIESRSGGATNDHTIVVTFGETVNVSGSPQAQITSGAATIGSNGVGNGGVVTVNANTVTIPLTNVANAQTINITLNGVNGSNNFAVPMRVLLGDTNNNGSVNASDLGQTKGQAGQTTTDSNLRNDVNANGAINAADVGLVKSQSGTSLP